MLTTLLIACSMLALSTAAPGPLDGRVVGGADANEAMFPHQVSMRYSGSHICGGSIISKTMVLTAAHCVTDTDAEGNLVTTPASVLSIRVGSVDRFAGGYLVKVAEVIVNKDYANFLNDLALLRLETPLIYSKQVIAIPLATAETPVGAEVIISGWGRLKTGGDLPRELQWNTLTALSNKRCQASTLMFSSSLICLGHSSGNGACNGDSGGPAIYNGELVGVAGFVMAGCGSSLPDGYAKVFHHRDWIIKHAGL